MTDNNTNVDSLVASLADKKRKDLELLRQYLTDNEQQASSTATATIMATPFFLQPQPQSQTSLLLKTTTTANKSTMKQAKTSTKTNKKKITTNNDTPPSLSSGWKVVRCLLLDLPLMLLFVSLAVVYVMRVCWTHYYIPIMDRAQRTDVDLLDEYTYYERSCTDQDVTEGFTVNTINTTTKEALDKLLMHGATTVPQLLQPATIAQLRQYLQHKNKVIAEEEEFPMSQGYKRLSYGLEATEDPAISLALAEITSNQLLPSLLEQVFGMADPALTEITAITAYYGAEDQVIHSDTKSDGYAAQFARTYSHTYSLFIPVQPITAEMGVTQLCPGTHYCTNDLEETCLRNMMGVNEAFEDQVWKAGDGVLLNQQTWHGGSRHSDPDNQERILFIVSFIARPQLGKDTRQLARGTYFHMKWNMWGHTFRDIATDFAISTAWPFNVLRSLSLWKPRNRNWGYDLLLAAALRAANNQNGMETDDLRTFIKLKMDRILPKWLQGSFSHRPDAWRTYVQETLDNTFLFLEAVNAVLLTVYLVVGAIITLAAPSLWTRRIFGLRSVLVRLMITHGIVACIAWSILSNIQSSKWATNIRKGWTFRRPFPTDNEFTSRRWESDPAIPKGPTTLPGRMDVLSGTRLDAPYLGSYNQWLDYHPGNRILNAAVAPRAHVYPMYNTNDHNHSPVVLRQLINEILEEVFSKGGRFLQQDHLSGDWVVLGRADAAELVRALLATESNMLLKTLNQQINFLVADYRFAAHRGTALAMESTIYLNQLRKSLLKTTQPLNQPTPSTKALCKVEPNKPPQRTKSFLRPRLASPLLQPMTTVPELLPGASGLFSSSDQEESSSSNMPTVGTHVMVFRSRTRTWHEATVTEVVGGEVGSSDSFDVAYDDDGLMEEEVSLRRIRKRVPIQEGVKVSAILEDDQAYSGTISMVYPSGNVDVLFDDGDVVQDIEILDLDILYPTFYNGE